jgi:DNA-binding transcriptional MocR family regulator
MTNEIINLTRGVPPREAFPVADLIECGTAAMQRDADTLLQYSHAGYRPLHEWLGKQYGVGPDQILTGNSSLELFSFIAEHLVEPGARVFIESPSYDRAITTLRRTGAEVVGIPLETDGVNLNVLEDELKKGAPTLMYVIADFQNPMGVTTSLEKRKRLVALAKEHDFWIVEDAPYRRLRYWGQDVPTVRSLAPERVLHLSSFSKLLSPGLRLGYAVGPADVITTLTRWAVDWYIGPVLPTQGMVYEYCRRGLLDDNIERLKQLYRPRLEAMRAALDNHMSQATQTKPEGGFFVSVMLPEGSDVTVLMARAREVGLLLSSGRFFFPNPDKGNRFLRLPFCSLTPAEIEEGISRLAGQL